MRTNNMKLEAIETYTARLAWGFASTVLLMLLLSVLLLVAGLSDSSFAQAAPSQAVQPKTFASPAEAGNALFQAVQEQDEPAVEAILGAGKEVTSSSDEVEDKLERERFSQKYQEMHRLVREPEGTTVLYIGAENWPFPVPLVSKNGQWYFDSDRGKQEILFRRVGENEATAIEVCEEFAMAKNEESAKAASEDPITQFAESLVSAGPANADNKKSNVFYGYYFRVVTNSASKVTGYGKKRGGLTLVAYPADYESSGVMTFVVTRHGIVYQKDLGSSTSKVAAQIKARTGSSWHPAV
ncbi:MAG: DUF2950 family protein [Candidatus Sulfotelmatobacter sp.]